MRLPKLSIENYQFVIVLVFIGLASGILSFINMPRSEDPALNAPFYNIIAIYPGTSPKDMEELVVDPIEDALNEIEDLKEVKASIQEGIAVIEAEAFFSVDIDEKYDEIVTEVNTVRDQLPEDLLRLDVEQFSPLDVQILQLALVSETAAYNELLEWAERLEDRVDKVDGVRTTEIEAYPEEEIRISLDFEKMARMNIPLQQVMGVMQSYNANIPGGDVNSGTQNFVLKTSGGYQTLEEIRATVVSAFEGKIIYLQDIASVEMAYEDPQYIARFNGERAIFLAVTQKDGYNILSIEKDLKAVVEDFRPQLPASVEVEAAFEQGPAVRTRVEDFFVNLLQGILLVGLVILIFLGIRNSLIIMTVIPTSILIAINVLDLSGFGLQQISIAALVIALGLLVDNGIVVVENIHRFLKEGYSPKEAAIKGTSEVGWAIVSSTVTTVLAFLPMTQLGGGTGAFIKSMPLTVIFTLTASLLLALMLTPLLGSKLLRPKVEEKMNAMNRFLQSLISRVYKPVLTFSLKRPLVIVLIALMSFAGSMALFPLVGISFFPAAEKPVFIVNINMPEGTNLDRTERAAQYVESILDTIPEVKNYSTNVGHGNPQVYYNIPPENYKKSFAQVLVNLDTWNKNRFYELLGELRAEFDGYAGARISVLEFKNGPPYEAPIAIKVIGDELPMLKRLSAQVEDIIASKEGTLNLDNPLALSKIELKTKINREKAGMLGLNLSDIDLAVRTAITGTEVGNMSRSDGKEFPMVLRMPYEQQTSMNDFNKIYLANMTGTQVPLKQVAKLEFQAGASKIDHYDFDRTTTLTADVKEGYNSRDITLSIIEDLEAMEFPEGYDYFVAGEFQTQQESFGDLGQLLIVAIFGILAVLILQFKSFRQPFIVLSAIPLAFSGSIVMLYLAGYSFSFLAFVGFTSLVGIVVNTSIILVDYSNQLLAKGMSVQEAVTQASLTRFTPILLTTMTTILGLLPLTLTGSSLWSPLGWTIIGGMISSTLLTLLIVPILYKWLTGKRETGSENMELA